MSTEVCARPGSPNDQALKQIGQLIDELDRAMSAAAENSIADLELSLWRQEMLCAALRRTIDQFRHQIPDSSWDMTSFGHLRSAGLALERVTQTYGSVVQQARSSVGSLLELCRLYQDPPVSSRGLLITALSCEV